MKSHPRHARIKGDPFIPSRFIFGDAVEEKGLEPYEYVIHTEAPAFVCRLVGMDLTPFDGRDKDGFHSEVLFDEQYNLTHYVTNSGFRLFDFNFWGELPTAAELKKICDEAMQVYQRLQKAYAEREVAPKERDFRVVPTEPLPPDHPLRTAPRTLLTPHLGYFTQDALRMFYSGAVTAILSWLDGHPVNLLTGPVLHD